jgi:alkylation response protein AidB-like acyl-CoA dehydrogenase
MVTNPKKNTLELAQNYCHNLVPEIIDQNETALQQALQGLGEHQLLALKVPESWGGAGFSELEYQQFQVLMARSSGILAFLQTQHQSAANLIFQGHNNSLKSEYLPKMAKGQKLVGIAFSHLRKEQPCFTAIPTTDGYLLNGTIPWLTGWNFFEEIIVGATLPDGQALYGIIPFQTTQSPQGKINLSQPMPLASMMATNTVSATIENWFLPYAKVVMIQPETAIFQSDRRKVLNHGFLALGCAFAGVDLIEKIAQEKQLLLLLEILPQLREKVNHCHQEMFKAIDFNDYDVKLKLRVSAIKLALRCSEIGITVASGAGNNLNHPAQRIYREALIFTVVGQNLPIMSETVTQLLDF